MTFTKKDKLYIGTLWCVAEAEQCAKDIIKLEKKAFKYINKANINIKTIKTNKL